MVWFGYVSKALVCYLVIMFIHAAEQRESWLSVFEVKAALFSCEVPDFQSPVV